MTSTDTPVTQEPRDLDMRAGAPRQKLDGAADLRTSLRPRLRDVQRDASRARVLDAARRLFSERGYGATTVRMVAEAASLSPAGVFTTFADKADILHHVRMAQNEAVRAALAEAARANPGAAVDRACAFVREAYRREWPDRGLVLAWIGESQTWSPTTEADCAEAHADLFSALDAVLAEGVAAGELRGDLDVPLARELIYGVYVGNWRRAAYAGWDAERTADHVERKIRLMFGGFKAPSPGA